MSRYARHAPKAWVADDLWDDDAPLEPAITVSDHVSVDTGLIWADGSTVWREPNPMGFGRDGEWQ